MNPNRPKPTASGLLTLIAAVLLSIGCYQADLYNVPVLAPWLDLLGAWLLRWKMIPANLFGPTTSMYVSAAFVGLVFLILATLLVASLFPSSKVSHLENRMRGIQRNRQRRPTKIE